MSRGVRGPTSALTEFLREKGISARGNLSRFSHRGDGDTPNTFSIEEEQQAEQATGSDTVGQSSRPATPAQNQARVGETTAQKLARIRASAQARTARKRKTFEESDDDDDDEGGDFDDDHGHSNPYKGQEDAQTSRTSGRARPSGASHNGGGPKMIKIRPPPSMVKPNGSLAYCSGCRRRFSVTPYTAYTARGPICHACGNNAAEDAEASAATARTKAQPAKRTPGAAARRKALLELQADRLPTLQELCITVLSRHTELIDDLSGVGDASQEKISQAISRNRRLNDDTVKLFLAPDLKELKLYDCSEVSAHTLRTLPDFCPQLEKINLQLCGQIDNDVLDAWGHKLGARHQLRSVELYGPFLVRQEAWQRFFQRVGSHLTSFKIRESARFNLPCTRSLAEHCPHLTELGLAQIGPLDGPALRPLHAFTNLTYLDISDPGVSAPGVPPKSLQDQDVLELLFHVGSHLQFLDVSGNADLSDAFLLAPRGGIKWTCRALLELNLSQLRLTAQGIKELFSDWKLDPPPPPPLQQCLLRGPSTPPGAGLRTLHLGRVRSVDDAVLEAVVRHSGPTLQWLSLNSDDELTGEGLGSLLRPERLPALRFLDVSFVRDVSDATVSPFLDIKESKRIHVFGCNRISAAVRSNRWTAVVGKEREF